MCGIVGYVGEREAWPLLVNCLKRVTYRGYDSFGIAVLNGHGIEILKKVGPVDAGDRSVSFKGNLGIGHTRWATVGAVSERNAHPHTDCTGTIAIVHNGDIDNYQQLRGQLTGEGHHLKSDTDSELIAHLIEKHRNGDLPEAVRRATAELQCSYAIAVMASERRELILTRKESPIAVGIGDCEVFVASDAPALLPYTDKVIYPEDGDVVVLSRDHVRILRNGTEVNRPVRAMEWKADQTEKGGFEHYMLKEIAEQPRAIANTLAGYVDGLPALPVARPGRVLLLGCGTSFHASLIGASWIRSLAEVITSAEVASESALIKLGAGASPGSAPESVPDPDSDDLVIAISQSGETADTLGVARLLKASGHRLVGITNVPESGLARLADTVLYTAAGPEVAVASTKTFTTQLSLLALIAARLASDAACAEKLSLDQRSLPVQVESVLSRTDELRSVGQWLGRFEHLFIVAKGANYPVALEAALKFKEVAYLHAEGVPAGELKHGPFALLLEETPVLAIVADDIHRTRVMTAVREIKARGAPIVALTSGDVRNVEEFASIVVSLPEVNPVLAPVIYTVACQLLSYFCARTRGCPIDRPRNLAKSVTVP
ncbi:MAG: glutamine--fructose-6-phosphate transaminase (isomerizing) [Chloroflexi bacterium]|nr:glutamine--fructose-6-phosphate transaminase (isomerizing) [Chloroflexota bacterium]